jgi:hypothetical protein
MLRLAKAFLDIGLWRQTPAHLPASSFLLLLVAVLAALMEVLGAWLPPSSLDGIVLRVAFSVGLPLAFTWALLAVAKRSPRFLQTGSALLGVSVLAECALYPLGSLLRIVGEDTLASIPIRLLLFVLLIWYLLACAHVWRSALDSGLLLGGLISVGYLVLSIALEQQVLPQT